MNPLLATSSSLAGIVGDSSATVLDSDKVKIEHVFVFQIDSRLERPFRRCVDTMLKISYHWAESFRIIGIGIAAYFVLLGTSKLIETIKKPRYPGNDDGITKPTKKTGTGRRTESSSGGGSGSSGGKGKKKPSANVEKEKPSTTATATTAAVETAAGSTSNEASQQTTQEGEANTDDEKVPATETTTNTTTTAASASDKTISSSQGAVTKGSDDEA